MAVDPTRCPRCGQRNQCAQAESDSAVTDCWCFALSISAAQLADLPTDPAQQSCLCPACAQTLKAPNQPD